MKTTGATRGRGWPSRTFIAIGSGIALLGALTGNAWAMGAPDPSTNTANVLAPDTMTVEGVATLPIPNPVTDITYAMTVTDSSVTAEMKDVSILEQHMRTTLKQVGISNGDIQFTTPSFNEGNSGAQTNLQLNVIVPSAGQVPHVIASLGSYSPSFLQNGFMSDQVVPLDPDALWPRLYQAALNSAHAQAATLANEAGVQLGSVNAISTVMPSGGVQPLTGPYSTSPSVPGLQLVYNNGNQAGEVMTELYVTYSISSSNA
ncbi:uncharacterized protein YggE [Alicyclobacillus sacchari]|uniref:Uncharacterized protein YggE n=1 Tax=Alicyclobacillus sacchari TaxID=392010 RepID=A0A4R8LL15_9BACL|nr:SIMPL domain-containing protein [Alicyclobacillus sacchari]TDY45218.1 uncharacterized protein YggE [Alicyclobacillus sacchari]